jgi:hypothetical protein
MFYSKSLVRVKKWTGQKTGSCPIAGFGIIDGGPSSPVSNCKSQYWHTQKVGLSTFRVVERIRLISV